MNKGKLMLLYVLVLTVGAVAQGADFLAEPDCIEPIKSDLNNDCRVDIFDFMVFSSNYLHSSPDPQEATVITSISDFYTYKSIPGTYHVDANSGTYTLTDHITVDANWTLIPINGDVIIDGNDGSYNFKFENGEYAIGDSTNTYKITFNHCNEVRCHATTMATTANFYNCDFLNATLNNFDVDGVSGAKAIVHCYDCYAEQQTLEHGADGYNLHGSIGGSHTTQNELHLHGCVATGHIQSENDDGATAHEFCKLFVYGGDYSNNDGGIICVNNSEVYLYGNIIVNDSIGSAIFQNGDLLYIDSSASITIGNANPGSGNSAFSGIYLIDVASIDILGTVGIDNTSSYPIWIRECDGHCIVNGNINITNANQHGIYIFNSLDGTFADDVILKGVSISGIGDTYHAVYLATNGTYFLSDLDLQGTMTSGHAVFLHSSRTIKANLYSSSMYDFRNEDFSGGRCINYLSASHTGYVKHCTFNNNDWCVDLCSDQVQVANNIFTNSDVGVTETGVGDYSDTLTSGYNWFYNNTTNVVSGSPIDSDDITDSDPKYIDALNSKFALQLTSPLIGAASDSSTIGDWQPDECYALDQVREMLMGIIN